MQSPFPTHSPFLSSPLLFSQVPISSVMRPLTTLLTHDAMPLHSARYACITFFEVLKRTEWIKLVFNECYPRLAVELHESRFKNTLSVFSAIALQHARVLSTHRRCDRRKFFTTMNTGLRLQHLTITVAHRNDILCFTAYHSPTTF